MTLCGETREEGTDLGQAHPFGMFMPGKTTKPRGGVGIDLRRLVAVEPALQEA